MLRRASSNVLGATFLGLLAACNGSSAQEQPSGAEIDGQGGSLGLFSTLPIYWGESEDITSMLDDDGGHGWVRDALEEDGQLVPLDTLEPEALEGLEHVVLAQPRPLAPSENVAFDAWLRQGGQALIFADPMLTQHSDYPLGDPRRPHDMVVISPILAHWGIELFFDEEQAGGERMVSAVEITIPVDLAGHFRVLERDAKARCTLSAKGLVADCRVGKGSALLIADAALLDDHSEMPGRRASLRALMARVFAD